MGRHGNMESLYILHVGDLRGDLGDSVEVSSPDGGTRLYGRSPTSVGDETMGLDGGTGDRSPRKGVVKGHLSRSVGQGQ